MLHKKSLTRDVLFMAASGTLILSSLFAPNVAQLLKPLMRWRRNWDTMDRRRIYNAIERLNKKRLIELIEKGDKIHIKITTNGKNLLKRFDYDDLELLKAKRWDKKWRLVIFDIPEKKKKERNALSEKLKDMGLYPLQESVFIYPYDCRDEFDFLVEFYRARKYVRFMVAEEIDNEPYLRTIFSL